MGGQVRYTCVAIPPKSVWVVFPTHTWGVYHSREEHDLIVDACGFVDLHV